MIYKNVKCTKCCKFEFISYSYDYLPSEVAPEQKICDDCMEIDDKKIYKKIFIGRSVLKSAETGVKDVIFLLKEVEALGLIDLNTRNALSQLDLAELKISQALENFDDIMKY